MTTDTPELDEQEAAPAAPTDEQAALPESEPVRFWQRPYVERYLIPLVLPILVVGGVVMFILNISRIFLSTHGNVDVVVGTVILLTILIGASLLAASPKMRTASLALITGGFVVAVMLFGWLALGTAEPEGEAGTTLPADGPAAYALGFASSNALKFVPEAATGQTGIANITLTNEGGEHTLHLEDGKTLFEQLGVQAAGDTDAGRAFFGEAGDYVFYCTVPGHREAGMEGVITITGETVTLDQAEAAAGEAPAPPAAGGGGGATPTTAANASTPTTARTGDEPAGPESETPTSTAG
jgi:plastocyanin